MHSDRRSEIFLLTGLFVSLLFSGCSRSQYVAKIERASIKAPSDVDEIYYSNYFSFQGEDEQGPVLFAIDNNRWKRKGDKFGAEHFLAMYADSQWVELKGKGKYSDSTQTLTSIPSSKWFTFAGTPQQGLTITSTPNNLKLVTAPFSRRTKSAQGYARFSMSSAKATLFWKGRTIHGRVIQEYLRAPNFSKRFKQFLTLGGGSFTGLYLSVAGKGDLYIHQNKKKEGGFAFISGLKESFLTYPVEKRWTQFTMHIKKTDKHLFYSFPERINITLSKEKPAVSLHIETVDQKTFSNLVLFGFAMGYVKGTLTVGSKKYQVYGFSELIAT